MRFRDFGKEVYPLRIAFSPFFTKKRWLFPSIINGDACMRVWSTFFSINTLCVNQYCDYTQRFPQWANHECKIFDSFFDHPITRCPHGVDGYHSCLTHRRSQVRVLLVTRPNFLFFCGTLFLTHWGDQLCDGLCVPLLLGAEYVWPCCFLLVILDVGIADLALVSWYRIATSCFVHS